MTWSAILPFPPSVNHYWRRVGSRTLISRAGRDYQTRVAEIVAATGRANLPDGWHAVTVRLRPPDRRQRDLDNHAGKALLDAVYRALGVDDSAIVWLQAEWCWHGAPRAEIMLRRADYQDGAVIIDE